MTAGHLHLLTAHLPVLGVPFAAGLLAAGLVGRSPALWRAGIVVLLLAAVACAVPYLSGPGTFEELRRSGLPAEPVERHAVAARAVALSLAVLAAVTVSSVLREVQGDPPSQPLRWVVLLGAISVSVGLGYAAHLGGAVRRPELRSPAPATKPYADAAGHADAAGVVRSGRPIIMP